LNERLQTRERLANSSISSLFGSFRDFHVVS
jgi:hypothetical protein